MTHENTCKVICWGSTLFGQIGPEPRPLLDNEFYRQVASLPAVVPGALPVGADCNNAQIAAGDAHSCAAEKSEIRCWGSNAYGQLGNGTMAQNETPQLAIKLVEP